MFQSIIDDIKMQFKIGNMLTRIILINILVFVVINLIIAFTGNMTLDSAVMNHPILDWLMVPSGWLELLKKPWTLFSHMFLHVGFGHIIWNMLFLYWFGRIVGDFYGDKRVLPLYILGGLAGVVVYLLADHFLPIGTGGQGHALGASAACMAMVFVGAATSPDYEFNLILIGRVKIKFIAAFFLFMDLVLTTGANSGGHFGHIGGAIFGYLFVSQIRNGIDLTEPLQGLFSMFDPDQMEKRVRKKKKSPIKIVHTNIERKANQKATCIIQIFKANWMEYWKRLAKKEWKNLRSKSKLS